MTDDVKPAPAPTEAVRGAAKLLDVTALNGHTVYTLHLHANTPGITRTLIFCKRNEYCPGCDVDGWVDRYETSEEAKHGHKRAVALAHTREPDE